MSEALEQIDATAERIRGELARTAAELDRRLRAATDVRAQLKRHVVAVSITGGFAVALIAVLLAVRTFSHSH